MFEKQKKEIIKAGLAMDRYGLVALTGGNVSCRMPGGEILVTPSGMVYADMQVQDVLVMDGGGKILEGSCKPSVDTGALLHIFKERPDVQAIIHTHQPYATAIGLVMEEFPVSVTTLANACKGSVLVAPFTSAASLEMGKLAVEYLTGRRLAVILKNHGVITVGDSLKQALGAAVYLEEAAKTHTYAMSMGTPALLNPVQVEQAVRVFDYYGQGSEQLPEEVLEMK